MKYNAGDEFLVKVTISRADEWDTRWPYRINIGEDSKNWVSEEDLDAAAYAAKAAPAPVSTAWEPKRDEVVLVEMEFVREKAGGEVYVQKGDGNFIAVPRSAIVGPAPARARFAVGDEAFSLSLMRPVKLGEYDTTDETRRVIYNNCVTWVQDADLLTMDEARERLAK